MATEENERNPYEGGTGGKFRKRPFRRAQTTPYDRPPNSLRNPNRNNNNNNNGWFSKLVVDPAQKLIANSARSLFSSLFRKRLPPPPPSPPPPQPSQPSSSETNQELRDNKQEEPASVANNSSGKQQGAVSESNVQIDCSVGGGFNELEKLLRQKTFTRSEIAHLTELLRSRTVDAPAPEEEKRREVVASDPMLACEPKEEYPKTPAPENDIENRLALTSYVPSSDPIEDVASPAELAKAYMGSRPSKASSTMLGLRSPALRDSPTLLKSENFPLKSSITSIVPRATRHAGVHENGFVTPRSRGRSAIYSMARTPYSRIYPTSALKGGQLAAEGEPSSSTQSALNLGMLSGSKQGAAKRRSLALDNDIGSVGPIRRVRHKSNLLYSQGSSLSIGRSGFGVDSAQQPSSSTQKSTQQENVNGVQRASFPSLPSKSSEMASKILQQLDKLVSPNDKSSESRLPTVSDKSPMKLSPSMLRGQALRSMEMVDSSKLLDDNQNSKLDGTLGNSSATTQKFFPLLDKVENGPLKLDAPSDKLVPVVTDAGATKPVDSSRLKSVSFSPQKKRAFRMSAHEDFLDLDDDAYPNGVVSSTVENATRNSVAMVEKTTTTGAIASENPPTFSVAKPSNGEAHVRTADGFRAGEKVNISTSVTSSLPDSTPNPVTLGVTAAAKTSFGSDNPASSNGSVAIPPMFNFGNKAVSSTVTGAPSDEINKSGSIFGFGKVPQTTVSFSSSDTILGGSVSSTTIAGPTDSVLKVHESDKGDTEAKTDTKFFARSSEPATASATATTSLTSTAGVFTFGHSSTPNQTNGSIASTPTFSTSQNIFGSSSLASSSNVSTAAASTGSSFMTNTPAIVSSSNISSSTPVVGSSSSTTSIFKFGAAPASSGLPISSSGPEPAETKSSQDSGVGNLGSSAFGSSSAAVGNTASGIFGFSSPSVKTLDSQSQGSTIGATASSSSVLGTQVSPATSGIAASTQAQSVSFGSSASFPSFGLTGSTALSSGSSLFSSSTPATNTAFSSGSAFGSSASSPSFGLTGSTASSGSSLFSSSTPATNTAFSSGSTSFPSSSPSTSIFNSGPTFGVGSSASTSAANSVSSNSGTSSTLFGSSSWQPGKSSFGSTFGSSSSSGFSFSATTASTSSPFGTSTAPVASGSTPFGTSTTTVASTSSPFGQSTASVASTSSPTMFLSGNSASTPQFSFSSAATTTSAFGSPSPVFNFGSAPAVNSNDHMSMEDSMAEDTIQASPPAAPVFGQQPAPAQSNFVFGAPPTSGASPFQFGGQQNLSPQTPSPFQASGSLEFNAGGSFSLGTGGGDKSGRKFVRVKHKQRKK